MSKEIPEIPRKMVNFFAVTGAISFSFFTSLVLSQLLEFTCVYGITSPSVLDVIASRIFLLYITAISAFLGGISFFLAAMICQHIIKIIFKSPSPFYALSGMGLIIAGVLLFVSLFSLDGYYILYSMFAIPIPIIMLIGMFLISFSLRPGGIFLVKELLNNKSDCKCECGDHKESDHDCECGECK